MVSRTRNFIQNAGERFSYYTKSMELSQKELKRQFTYFLSSEDKKKELRKEWGEDFVPLRMSKMARKMIRSGRIA